MPLKHHIDGRQPLPRLFLHPAQPAGQHLAEVAAVSKGHKRITIGKLAQHTRVLLQDAEHDVEARSSAISSSPLTAMKNYGGFRFAFRDPVRGQRGFAERRSPSSRARSTPPDGEHGGNGSLKRLHMGYGGSPVHFDFLELPFKDAGDP